MTAHPGRGRAVVAAVLAGWTLLAAGPALAAPGVTGAAAARPVQGDPVDTDPTGTPSQPDESLPVKVTIEQLEPREVKPGATVRVVAVLRNTGTTPTGPLKYRLQRGPLITTRSELAAADKVAPLITTQFAQSTPLPDGLAPGQALRVRYECSADELRLLGVGVYPLGFTVTDTSNGSQVGRAQTLLPSFAGVDPVPTRVAWLWPLLDRPHRLLGDVAGQPLFDSDELARSVSKRGRLDQLLAAAEAVTGRVSLTLVVDPETIEELQLMTRSYRYGSLGRSSVGRGQLAAADWLRRLRVIAKRHLLAVLPYGDPDIVALDRAHLTTLGEPTDADRALVTDALGAVQATTQLAWPAGDVLTDTALDDVIRSGASAVVLDPAALRGGATPAPRTPSAVAPLPSLEGQASALVTDAALQSIVAHAASFPGGTRLAEQRYLAELAMIGAEAPAVQRTLVIAPPRRWSPSLPYAAQVLADTARISWLTSLTAGAVIASTPPVDRGPLVYPPAALRAELPQNQLGTLRELRQEIADFQSLLTNSDAKLLLSAYPDAQRRAASSAWRSDPARQAAYLDGMERGIRLLRGQIRIQKPVSGIYSLASSDSPLTLTIVNSLPTPVTIGIRINRPPPGFRIKDIGPQIIPARSRHSLRLPANVQRTGTFRVDIRLTTPGPQPHDVGGGVTLTVRSTAYGSLALGITGAALVILIAAMIFRMVIRLRSGPGEPAPAGSPADRSLS
ncbi:MAG: hypothetical protein V7637_4046 [Mycobacteriales bacterium]